MNKKNVFLSIFVAVAFLSAAGTQVRFGPAMKSYRYEQGTINWQHIPKGGIEVAGCTIKINETVNFFMNYMNLDCGDFVAEIHEAWMGGDTTIDSKHVWGITYTFYGHDGYKFVETLGVFEDLRVGKILFQRVDGDFFYAQLP